MKEKTVIVFDCGATNVRAVAITESGKILASHSLPNVTRPDPFYPNGLIWDVNEIWDKFCQCSRKVISQIKKEDICAVTVTTFGVNGTFMNRTGEFKYPVISWQCQRTVPVMQNIGKYIPLEEIYQINGLQPFNFNTITSLIWLKENKPEFIEKSDSFVFISSIFLYYLTGNYVTDTSMAGTSMLTDIRTRDFSDVILDKIGFSKEIFPALVEPGDVVGKVNQKGFEQSGVPVGVPVVASGHDTQFAIYGSGAAINQPVLSSGTWEILMVRTKNANLNINALKNGITTEYDGIPGIYNPGVQWLASGILEWIKKMFYSTEASFENIYDIMISEAEKIPTGKIKFDPDFLNEKGGINEIGLNTKRGEIYRAALIALAQKTTDGLKILEEAGNFKADSIICVGGGSKNRLWNQLRANALAIPVKTINITETTVLGAALFAFSGVKVFNTTDEARENIDYKLNTIEPG